MNFLLAVRKLHGSLFKCCFLSSSGTTLEKYLNNKTMSANLKSPGWFFINQSLDLSGKNICNFLETNIKKWLAFTNKNCRHGFDWHVLMRLKRWQILVQVKIWATVDFIKAKIESTVEHQFVLAITKISVKFKYSFGEFHLAFQRCTGLSAW